MTAALSITPTDIEQMVLHWLSTPAGSYLGSSYGHNLKNPLQRPTMDLRMEEVIEKMTQDIPILGALGAGAVNLYAYQGEKLTDIDLVVEVAGMSIPVPKD